MSADLSLLPAIPGSLAAPPGLVAKLVLGVFVAVPLACLVAGVPVALVHGWVRPADLVMLVVLYYVGIHGVTLGYHRLFTHRSYTTGRTMRIVLAVAGSVAIQGRVVDWVGDHRRHHQYSDQDGDPHSPWEYGTSARAVGRGLLHAHLGWLFTYRGTDVAHYAPDMVADKDLVRVSRAWPLIAVLSLGLPALVGFVLDGWAGALMGFFWAGLVRVALLHHMTWSINSLCHVFGKRQFASRDQSTNLAWMAPFAAGESWHNYHHADPSSARHGVLAHQWDSSAWILRRLERAGLVWNVKWPSAQRVASKTLKTTADPHPDLLRDRPST